MEESDILKLKDDDDDAIILTTKSYKCISIFDHENYHNMIIKNN